VRCRGRASAAGRGNTHLIPSAVPSPHGPEIKQPHRVQRLLPEQATSIDKFSRPGPVVRQIAAERAPPWGRCQNFCGRGVAGAQRNRWWACSWDGGEAPLHSATVGSVTVLVALPVFGVVAPSGFVTSPLVGAAAAGPAPPAGRWPCALYAIWVRFCLPGVGLDAGRCALGTVWGADRVVGCLVRGRSRFCW